MTTFKQNENHRGSDFNFYDLYIVCKTIHWAIRVLTPVTVVQSVYFHCIPRTELKIRIPKFHVLVSNSYYSWSPVFSKCPPIIVHDWLIVVRHAQLINRSPTVFVKLVWETLKRKMERPLRTLAILSGNTKLIAILTMRTTSLKLLSKMLQQSLW